MSTERSRIKPLRNDASITDIEIRYDKKQNRDSVASVAGMGDTMEINVLGGEGRDAANVAESSITTPQDKSALSASELAPCYSCSDYEQCYQSHSEQAGNASSKEVFAVMLAERKEQYREFGLAQSQNTMDEERITLRSRGYPSHIYDEQPKRAFDWRFDSFAKWSKMPTTPTLTTLNINCARSDWGLNSERRIKDILICSGGDRVLEDLFKYPEFNVLERTREGRREKSGLRTVVNMDYKPSEMPPQTPDIGIDKVIAKNKIVEPSPSSLYTPQKSRRWDEDNDDDDAEVLNDWIRKNSARIDGIAATANDRNHLDHSHSSPPEQTTFSCDESGLGPAEIQSGGSDESVVSAAPGSLTGLETIETQLGDVQISSTLRHDTTSRESAKLNIGADVEVMRAKMREYERRCASAWGAYDEVERKLLDLENDIEVYELKIAEYDAHADKMEAREREWKQYCELLEEQIKEKQSHDAFPILCDKFAAKTITNGLSSVFADSPDPPVTGDFDAGIPKIAPTNISEDYDSSVYGETPISGNNEFVRVASTDTKEFQPYLKPPAHNSVPGLQPSTPALSRFSSNQIRWPMNIRQDISKFLAQWVNEANARETMQPLSTFIHLSTNHMEHFIGHLSTNHMEHFIGDLMVPYNGLLLLMGNFGFQFLEDHLACSLEERCLDRELYMNWEVREATHHLAPGGRNISQLLREVHRVCSDAGGTLQKIILEAESRPEDSNRKLEQCAINCTLSQTQKSNLLHQQGQNKRLLYQQEELAHRLQKSENPLCQITKEICESIDGDSQEHMKAQLVQYGEYGSRVSVAKIILSERNIGSSERLHAVEQLLASEESKEAHLFRKLKSVTLEFQQYKEDYRNLKAEKAELEKVIDKLTEHAENSTESTQYMNDRFKLAIDVEKVRLKRENVRIKEENQRLLHLSNVARTCIEELHKGRDEVNEDTFQNTILAQDTTRSLLETLESPLPPEAPAILSPRALPLPNAPETLFQLETSQTASFRPAQPARWTLRESRIRNGAIYKRTREAQRGGRASEKRARAESNTLQEKALATLCGWEEKPYIPESKRLESLHRLAMISTF